MRRFAFYSLLTVLTMVALAILAVNYVTNNFRVTKVERANGADVSIQTPVGQIKIRGHENVDLASLGVPVYPGAKHSKDGGSASFEWNSSDGKYDKAMAVAGGEYITSDAADVVQAWYHERLPNWVVVTNRNEEKAHFELNEGGYKRIIAIREKSDGTHIGVASFGEPASN